MVKEMQLAEEGKRLTEEEKDQIMAVVGQLVDIYSSFEDLQRLQSNLKTRNVEHRMTLNKLEESRKKTVKGIYEKRDAIIKKIPKFWMKSFLGHTELVEKLTEMDREILGYLDSFHVDSRPNDNGYIITLGFHQNPFFENTELVIPYLAKSVAASKINWKSTVTQRSVRLFNDSLWTESDDAEYTDDMAESDDAEYTDDMVESDDAEHSDDLADFQANVLNAIAIELWKNPSLYYKP